jgi:hypothetical protein
MTISNVVEAHGHFAHGGNPYDTAEIWAESGFEAREVDEWFNARCFDPNPAARDLDDTGVTPEMARMKTNAGAGDYIDAVGIDAVGFKVSDNDLEVEESRDSPRCQLKEESFQ